ncbi:MAG: NAD(P)H-hydrate dehydratase [Clostridia bacterium]|nr:NAD(P)H-hydrate dehydratase [Clostridia bacterium]
MTTTKEYVISKLPKRLPDSNKGTYGRVMLICGSKNMRGAAALATLGALRCGAGLVTLASTKEVIDSLSSSVFEAIYADRDACDIIKDSDRMNAVGIGCGMGRDAKEYMPSLILRDGAPLIIDADGINALSGNTGILKKAKRSIILTPHPLEFSRISGLSVEEIQRNRESIAKAFAKEYGVTLLLKGNRTVITDGDALFVNPTGNSALAKGGTGDVLCGMICAFAAQRCSAIDAAVIGAYIHGLSGERLAKIYSEYGVLASELPAEAAKTICDLYKKSISV